MTSLFANKKTNQKGFSHHFILPALAILLVAGIGGYVMLRSSSASTTKSLLPVGCTDKRVSSNPVTCSSYKHIDDGLRNKLKEAVYKTDENSKQVLSKKAVYQKVKIKDSFTLKVVGVTKKSRTLELTPPELVRKWHAVNHNARQR